MNSNRLQQLIELYWEGRTTPEEEKDICLFFASNSNLPPEQEQWRNWFMGKELVNLGVPNDAFDDKILRYVQQAQTKKRRRLRYVLLSVVAAAMIVLAWNFNGLLFPERNAYNAEVQEDYEKVMEWLYFTSTKITLTETVFEENMGKADVINEYIK